MAANHDQDVFVGKGKNHLIASAGKSRLAGLIMQEEGWLITTWFLGVLSGVTAISAFLWMGGFILENKR